MIQATQLKKGMCIKHENDLWRIVSTHHLTPGNWRGMVQTKIRNLKTGAISEHRFRSEDRVVKNLVTDPYAVALSRLPCTSWTHRPPRISTAGKIFIRISGSSSEWP